MAFFRTVSFSEPVQVVPGERVMLRTPQMNDYPSWAELREASRDFLAPWEPIWPPDDLTRSAFRRRIRRYSEEQRADQAYPFFLFREPDNVLVGGLTLANVRRGVAQSATLGYWMGLAYARQGYMAAGLRAIIPYAFGPLRLHRIEAGCIPTNLPSIRLLEKSGFRREGLAREYLCINGMWQDHVLFALLRDDPRP